MLSNFKNPIILESLEKLVAGMRLVCEKLNIFTVNISSSPTAPILSEKSLCYAMEDEVSAEVDNLMLEDIDTRGMHIPLICLGCN